MEQRRRIPGSARHRDSFNFEHRHLVGAALCGSDVSDLVFAGGHCGGHAGGHAQFYPHQYLSWVRQAMSAPLWPNTMGAGRYHRIGPALWQGVYISLFGGLVLLCVIPLAEPAFRLIGHSPSDSETRGRLFSDPVSGRWCLHRVLCTFRIFQRSGENLAGNVGKHRDYGDKSSPGLRPDLRSLGVSRSWESEALP